MRHDVERDCRTAGPDWACHKRIVRLGVRQDLIRQVALEPNSRTVVHDRGKLGQMSGVWTGQSRMGASCTILCILDGAGD